MPSKILQRDYHLRSRIIINDVEEMDTTPNPTPPSSLAIIPYIDPSTLFNPQPKSNIIQPRLDEEEVMEHLILYGGLFPILDHSYTNKYYEYLVNKLPIRLYLCGIDRSIQDTHFAITLTSLHPSLSAWEFTVEWPRDYKTLFTEVHELYKSASSFFPALKQGERIRPWMLFEGDLDGERTLLYDIIPVRFRTHTGANAFMQRNNLSANFYYRQ